MGVMYELVGRSYRRWRSLLQLHLECYKKVVSAEIYIDDVIMFNLDDVITSLIMSLIINILFYFI